MSTHVKEQVTFEEVRSAAAGYLRTHREEYAPFIGIDDDREYQEYCDKVESTVMAEWGGHVEIQALCCYFRCTALIYSADRPVIVVNPTRDSVFTTPPTASLRLSFHRHYYALGEHYNSVVNVSP
jgi:OTU domain-containing protein 6